MFILGLGAQKSGTTWLHQQLSQKDDYLAIPKKEWHYWDRAFNVRKSRNIELEPPEDFLRNREVKSSLPKAPYFLLVSAMERGWLGKEEGRRTVADITPSYSGLPLGALEQISAGLDNHNIDYRVVYLMRDPVERISSAVRMMFDKEKKTRSLRLSSETEFFDAFAVEYARAWDSQFRTRYELTLENIKQCFNAERVWIGFTEELSDTNHLHELAGFLEMDSGTLGKEKVHVTQFKHDLGAETRRTIARLYRRTYEEISENYPRVRSLWGGFASLDDT